MPVYPGAPECVTEPFTAIIDTSRERRALDNALMVIADNLS
jgi:hypothetical protein